MTQDEQGWSRSEFARWFLDHDQVDEAARVLEPGDRLPLGRSDYLDLEAALTRRGLAAHYEAGHLQVLPGNAAATSPRKPPRRTTPVPNPSAAAKKTA